LRNNKIVVMKQKSKITKLKKIEKKNIYL
jgi:hypothetical protein